ncbi:forkhead domain 3F isoform X2 [Musca autumnalis]|uniref:forkhead domain 3F isoform X2 n=1 Tax=Musca autumnalis TaxID=221902 RepID=UPI003CF8CBCE
MILNMPVTNGAVSNTQSGQSEFCDFLKRKYPDDENGNNRQNNQNQSVENQNSDSNNSWKKAKHNEEMDDEAKANYEMVADTTSPATAYNGGEISTSSPEKYPINNGSSPVTTTTNITCSNSQAEATTTPNVNSSNSNTFNIMTNNPAFINDLFAYDANLLVPTTSSDNLLSNGEPCFTAPSAICVNTTQQFSEDNGDNWQATDLLELDHRYNSTLQTEITQLNPTVSLKPHEENLVTLVEQQHNSSHQHPQQHPSNHSPYMHHQENQEQNSKSAQLTGKQLPPAHNQPPAVDNEPDFEDRNLSWLLNFKFDEFPHLNPDLSGVQNKSLKSTLHCNGSSAGGGSYKVINGNSHSGTQSGRERSKSPKNKAGRKFEELVMEVTSEMEGSDMVVAENVVIEDTTIPQRAPKKPPFTYTELIEYALEDKGELTVSGIYTWISDRFPYYKSNDDRWKNSVRHNLSINPHFRKGHKAPQGAGHLWTISSGDSAENVLAWEHKKQRLDLFFKMESMNRERLAQQQKQQQSSNNIRPQSHSNNSQHNGSSSQDPSLYDEAAVAAAAIQQEMLQQGHHPTTAKDISHHPHHRTSLHPNIDNVQQQQQQHHHHHSQSLHDLPYNELLCEEELRKTAGQILNGIHREVEVQSVNHHQPIISTYQDVLLDNDYLNPIHKDVAVNESGLHQVHTTIPSTGSSHPSHCTTTTPYYVTEIDPMELGIQMSSHPNPLVHSQSNTNHHQHHHQHNHHPHQSNHHHHSHVDANSSLNGDETDVILFNDEFNLNYFTYNPATDIVA